MVNTAAFSWQWLGASYQMAERYYTKNGLPIEEDQTFDKSTMHEIITTPGASAPEYTPLLGYMQPGAQTIRLYMNREPVFMPTWALQVDTGAHISCVLIP
ncbi:hypothetical protein KRR40_23025 [Niabella defluvii]|nr:hypothetical protein KRR40_23025 [Niabella sp. I65]